MKKKAGASVPGQESTEEPTETTAEVAEEDKVEETSISPKLKEPKGKTVRHRPIRAKGTEIPKTILKRKKAMNYWLWAAPAAIVLTFA
ncbi:cyclophilin peptidyl-prolyl cis-trans isomerase Cyp2 [Datura stramonium]|uniref:Cyclophilin peptidyl-prolyl cis-trans isomerase Cyp2 n=1 Tax=Datura stramonium TaxID=4076 RepID=A0ABS8T6F1_DATST|nr:cyclophilin peptidyl-prolyl cis-trans isomerase Cyp2 [Datura stramonium]